MMAKEEFLKAVNAKFRAYVEDGETDTIMTFSPPRADTMEWVTYFIHTHEGEEELWYAGWSRTDGIMMTRQTSQKMTLLKLGNHE